MAQVMIERTSKGWLWVLAGVSALSLAIAWQRWSAHDEVLEATASPLQQDQALTTAPEAVTPQHTAEDHARLEQLKTEQAQAKEVILQTAPEPIKTTVIQRPSYVSEMEWAALKAVADQHPDPEGQLTRLTNSLRFAKQLELWQDMPKDQPDAKRHELAVALVKDLPERVKHGDFALKDAQQMLAGLLDDAERDPELRTRRGAQEAHRLAQADAAWRKAQNIQ
ncbi:hypothetical protein EYS42_06970 [Aquabacterium lacunae]|uniref:Uncharacterized protein n=1 Tax=Aquabacterium lacunae TaxID=2528630 RepID=A0A4Q9H0S6_9BURK|nr:hypothetical protein [Aquabacterium lacunae]TBO32899.1 hypothetical protein EYS42_06970 [Aquabacterium lacunae]